MKHKILILTLSALIALVPQLLEASETSLLIKYAQKVEISHLSHKQTKSAIGMETLWGETFSHADVKSPKWDKKTGLLGVLSKAQIELKSGQIIYPEEVRFGLIPKNFGNGIDGIDIVGKAPHSH